MEVREYEPSDRGACLDVFDSLRPAPEAAVRRQFETFLDGNPDRYFVLEHDASVVGCGGYSLSADGDVAVLRWGMIGTHCQRMGAGRYLLMYRIREIGKHGNAKIVVAQVPAGAASFFERQGCRRTGVSGPFDWQEMVKKLAVCP
jgi:ribosomal-protein-alanine N-acetyltransferase